MKTVVAVGVVIVNEENRVLIAKRKPDQPMPNQWEFPGGKLEEGESLAECASREIREELELDIITTEYIGYEDIHYKGTKFVLNLFFAKQVDIEQEVVLNEHTDFRWLQPSEVAQYDVPATHLKIYMDIIQKLKDRE